MNSHYLIRHAFAALICLATTLAAAPTSAQSFGINISSLVGSSGEDAISAAEIQSDGTILIGGTFASAPDFVEAETLGAASDDDNGYVFVVSSDGLTVERTLRVGASVHDMAVDGDDNIFIAAGSSGVVQLDPNFEWRRTKTVGHVYRVDAGGGSVVTLSPSNLEDPHHAPGPGTISLLDIDSGAERASFPGHNHTLDVCLDEDSQTIGSIGWRQDEVDGLPTDIAYLSGYGYSGFINWVGYDWSADPEADDYINSSGDNAAATRGYRCSVGADGKLYAAFEADGADHMLRFSPADVESPIDIVGGDKFHEFSNVRSEQKVFFARYEPSDGRFLLGQQLVARVGADSGNTVRIRRGAIEADATGNVYLAGESAFGLPIQYLPPGTGDYTGGAFLLSMSSDFEERRYVTRVTPDGAAHDVAAQPEIGDSGIVVYGGVHRLAEDRFFTSNQYQEAAGGETDGFVTIFGEGVDDGASDGGGNGDDEGCGCASTPSHPASNLALALVVLVAARGGRRLLS